ncbi:hypothetical protein PACTADRAFT_50307 [Pachysolen tannophilus NRRL Y-2460]|uniref:Histone deacetylase interacting domain-containing protein n=1 Tax=Pachysolen tannophilus NRRL Y-2460 TaxID=669874 RepID=A0A1E4TV20_PACTA|nr:hypothetical protein PACTADRAFT_50307 [Pachysolen tannophilus NRRL Y-2460]
MQNNNWKGPDNQDNNPNTQDNNKPGIQPPFQRHQNGPPILRPPSSLENGQSYYSLPSLPGLGSHNPSGGYGMPPINNPPGIHQDQSQSTNSLPPPPVPPQPPMSNTTGPAPSQTNSPPNNQAQLSAAPGSGLAAYRPLNVKDALSYLDQVKVQFQNQPDVYNHFLDVMKDFKSQTIDTPGVIDRVSSLFRGHPNLIQGFNTFLPPGYRIECSLDPSDPNPIRVTTPMGTTTRPGTTGDFEKREWGQPILQPSQESDQQQQQQQQIASQQQHAQSYAQPQPQQVGPPHPLGINAQQPPMGVPPSNSGSPVEFNHAISYVNKIKTRFANQPDIYKHFLEILQTYQREQKPIGEVYQQVTVLFQNAPDLLDDFKQFLPDTSAKIPVPLPQQEHFVPPRNDANNGNAGNKSMQLPPVGNFPPPSAGGGMNQPPTKDRKKKGSITSSNEIATSDIRGPPIQTSKRGRKENAQRAMEVIQDQEYQSKNSTLSEEIGFFDKVKKAIGNKQTYNEFLKMINLYSQEIIDKDTLIERVEGFIGPYKDLFDWFKHFVGFEDTPMNIENVTFKKHQLELSLCKSCGPSYRLLPKAETYMPCSGRDDMCWEVLNDEWVGHPTWASEDSGFIAHRKNQYEEILFRIEEERHEYDYYMEANLRTIQTLETIANRIANMTPEEKAHFKLPEGLGHTSLTIYKKVIRKIYDKDRGFEVIDALHENPAVAVPIVLKRLKQKDEEWKRSHREWNKVWREMEQKVFFKSLDHLGLTFKQADKKLLTTKQLISEISTIKIEQTQKRLHPLTPKPKEQLEYSFKDYEILMDIVKLVLIFLNHSSSYSANDRERLEQFFKTFLSLFFSLSSDYIEESLTSRDFGGNVSPQPSEESSDTLDVRDSFVPSVASSPEPSLHKSLKKRLHGDTDLLKDVLRRNNFKQAKNKKENTPESSSSYSTPQPESQSEAIGADADLPEELTKAAESWIETLATYGDEQPSAKEYESSPRHNFNMFCNTNIYIFFRYLRTMYERLEELKAMRAEVDNEIKSRTDTKFAKDLDLFSHQIEDMGINITGNNSYLEALKLSAKLIEGDLEHQWFEESLRQGYRNKAYKLFTVDKVIQGIIKHAHIILTDHKTSEIMLLFEKDRNMPVTTAKQQILYRMQTRSFMGAEDHMFRIMFNDVQNTVVIQYVGLDDLTLKEFKNDDAKYNYYVTSYVMSHPTESVQANKLTLPFLKDNLQEEEDDDDEDDELKGFIDSQLKVKIDKNTYKLFFENGSYDEFSRDSVYSNTLKKSAKTIESRVEKLSSALAGTNGWSKDLSETEVTNAEEKFKTLINNGPEAYKKWTDPVVNEEEKELGNGKQEAEAISEDTNDSQEKTGASGKGQDKEVSSSEHQDEESKQDITKEVSRQDSFEKEKDEKVDGNSNLSEEKSKGEELSDKPTAKATENFPSSAEVAQQETNATTASSTSGGAENSSSQTILNTPASTTVGGYEIKKDNDGDVDMTN